MSNTPHPLIWDYHRMVNNYGDLGGVAHYYDEDSQSIWLSSGIKTNISSVSQGHWKTSILEDTIDIGTPEYTSLELDHVYNGVLFGVATLGSALVYLRYVYAIDCSDFIASGSINYSNDNSNVQIKSNLMNIKSEVFNSESTVFQPGARIVLKILAGEEAPLDFCTAYLDSVDFNERSNTVPISGRNNIGYKLMQSTFDEDFTWAGKPQEISQKIATLAGVKKLVVQGTDDTREFEFKANQTLMSGLEKLCDLYPGWKILELPNGSVVVGSQSFVNNYQGTGYYVFEQGSVFKRKTKKSSDAAYTKVRVTGKDAEGNDLVPVVIPVNNYKQWGLPSNKTYHESLPDGFTQEEMQAYAETLAESIQYVGIGEDFSGSFQPQLCIGDIATLDNGDGTSTSLGVVTSIKHSFGKSGYFTEFSTDSGGLLMETLGLDDNIITVTRPLNGYTRKQTLKDLIQVASGASKAGPQTTGTTVKVVSSSNAQTLGGKTYQQIITDARETPHFDLVSLGLPTIPTTNTVVTLAADMTLLREYLSLGQIKVKVKIGSESDYFQPEFTLDPMYLSEEDAYQTVSMGYYNNTYFRLLMRFDSKQLSAKIITE